MKVRYSENADVYPGLVTRNNAVVEYERFIHRTFYPYIIHPNSRFRVNWELSYIALITLKLFVEPWLVVGVERHSWVYHIPIVLMDLVAFVDVAMNFFTGYIDQKTETAVLDPRKIVSNYLCTWFVLDFLPCVPADTIGRLIWESCTNNLFREYNTCNLVRDLFAFTKGFRLITLLRYCRHLSKIKIWNDYLVALFCIFLTTTCIVFYCNNLIARFYYLNLVVTNTSALYATHKQEIRAVITSADTFNTSHASSVTLATTFFCAIIFCTYLMKYWLTYFESKHNFHELESRIACFMRSRGLTVTLKNRSLLYFRVIKENKHRDTEIIGYIPDMYRAELSFLACLPLLKNFRPFEDLPTYMLKKIAECMKYQLYLPNDVIVQRESTAMFFVFRGTVALYSNKHTELYHFESGSSFNGRNLFYDDLSSMTYAISVEVSEVYRLEREDYMNVMRNYPRFLDMVEERFRLNKTGSNVLINE